MPNAEADVGAIANAAILAMAHTETMPPLLVYTVFNSVQTDVTAEAVSNTANGISYLAEVPHTGDAVYFFSEVPFNQINLNVDTTGVGTWTITWQYYEQGSLWTSLSGVADGTNGFKTAGSKTVSYTMPTDWMRSLTYSASSLNMDLWSAHFLLIPQ